MESGDAIKELPADLRAAVERALEPAAADAQQARQAGATGDLELLRIVFALGRAWVEQLGGAEERQAIVSPLSAALLREVETKANRYALGVLVGFDVPLPGSAVLEELPAGGEPRRDPQWLRGFDHGEKVRKAVVS